MLENARTRRIPGLPIHWQHFLVCCLFHFVFPLAPFATELLLDSHVSASTLTVGAAVYVMALGASSRNMAIYAVSVILGFVYSVLFGLILAKAAAPTAKAPSVVWWTMGIVVFFHLVERFNRHVMDRTPYWEFTMEARKP